MANKAGRPKLNKTKKQIAAAKAAKYSNVTLSKETKALFDDYRDCLNAKIGIELTNSQALTYALKDALKDIQTR